MYMNYIHIICGHTYTSADLNWSLTPEIILGRMSGVKYHRADWSRDGWASTANIHNIGSGALEGETDKRKIKKGSGVTGWGNMNDRRHQTNRRGRTHITLLNTRGIFRRERHLLLICSFGVFLFLSLFLFMFFFFFLILLPLLFFLSLVPACPQNHRGISTWTQEHLWDFSWHRCISLP